MRMKHFNILIFLSLLLASCSGNSDLKKPLAEMQVCMLQCDELENSNTFNFFKCSQACVDLYEKKKLVCMTMEPAVRERGFVEIAEARDQCIAHCQEQFIAIRKQTIEQIKKCKEICIYNFKK
jgi:hypothetical protein